MGAQGIVRGAAAMNQLVLHLIPAGLLAALAGLVALPAHLRGRPRTVLLTWLICLLSVGNYFHFGFFRQIGSSWLHQTDVFHYYMGEKYLEELGYFELYNAAVLAATEDNLTLPGVSMVRNLRTYELQAPEPSAREIRDRFTPDRWRAFKQDLAFFHRHVSNWAAVLQDHGYNPPPTRRALLRPILDLLPLNLPVLYALTTLDFAILLAAAFVVSRAFGPFAAAATFSALALNPFSTFDWVGGSILRYDWLAALLMAMAFLRLNRPAAAGALLAYAALQRVFPVVFLLPVAARWLTDRNPEPRRVLVAAALTAAAGLACALTLKGAPVLFAEFADKMALHGSHAASNRIGFSRVVLLLPWLQGGGPAAD
jgi:hypothetical protein